MQHDNHENHSKFSEGNPCTDRLTDLDFLNHMIPHHQVANDMSIAMSAISKNPTILHLCRDIIRKQNYEIWEMNILREKLPETVFTSDKGDITPIKTKLDMYNPKESVAKEGVCNPMFFEPDNHKKHMQHMQLNDESFLIHMVPHHQVAVDMSRRLLLHTNNGYMLDFCNRLIYDQQGEIFYMNNILHNAYNYNSELLSQ
jgi:uncharacterized protein (DUF305 family)